MISSNLEGITRFLPLSNGGGLKLVENLRICMLRVVFYDSSKFQIVVSTDNPSFLIHDQHKSIVICNVIVYFYVHVKKLLEILEQLIKFFKRNAYC